jgi:4-alpha-glucanotransferase
MGKLKLFIGIYNSFSPSMAEEERTRLYEKSLKQYLTKIYNKKNVKLFLYYNGRLLSWIEKQHPEYITVLEELVLRRQAELLNGPYDEPILPIIPVSDRLGQLEKMTTYLRRLFKKRFRGCWLPGFVWESALSSNLCGAGINYTFLEVEQFERSGVKSLYEPVLTDDQGKSVVIFPLHRELSDSAMKAPPANTISSLRKISNESRDVRMVNLVFPGEIMADEDKQVWFEEFLDLIEKNREWIDCQLPSQYMKNHEGGLNRVYFNSSTYGDLKRFFHDKDGLLPDINPPGENDPYRAILRNNQQQSYYYGRLNYITLLINSIRGDKARKKSARENLWKAQNIYSFWAGDMAFQSKRDGFVSLIEAEKTTREKGIFNSSIIETDYDLDGQREFVFQGLIYNGCVHLKGGALFELDYLPTCWNYCFNKMGRRSFIDGFLPEGFNSDRYFKYRETLSDDSLFPYRIKDASRDEKQIILKGNFPVLDRSNNPCTMGITKKYLFKRNWFVVSYLFENRTDQSREFHFGTEINLSLCGSENSNSDISFVTSKDKHDIEKSCVTHCSSVMMLDKKNNTDIQLDFGEDMDLWYLLDQETMTLVPWMQFSLYPQGTKEITISLKLGRHKS